MHSKIQISNWFWILIPALLLMLPLRLVIAWFLAITLHETGHYIALRLCDVPIYYLTLTPFGAQMHTGELQGYREIVCALAGPLFALMFTVFSSFLPCTAVCILFQSIYNLLPIYPLDGGRVLRTVLVRRFSSSTAKIIEIGIMLLMGICILLLFHRIQLGLGLKVMIIFIFTQKFLANCRNKGYNRGE